MSSGRQSGPKTREVFPSEVVERYRKRALAVRKKLRNRGPHEWCRADFDAGALFDVFPNVRLRPGYRLLTYLYHSGGNGNGRVVAFSEESDAYRSIAAVPAGQPLESPPWVEDEILHPLQVSDGDGSALAYLSASLLMRELHEVGAEWHGIHWDVEHVMAPTLAHLAGKRRPSRHNQSLQDLVDELGWTQGKSDIESLAPEVRFEDGVVRVVLHIHTGLGREQVTRCADIYTDSYLPARECEVVAVGGPGFMF